jgi:hypothetical protein
MYTVIGCPTRSRSKNKQIKQKWALIVSESNQFVPKLDDIEFPVYSDTHEHKASKK